MNKNTIILGIDQGNVESGVLSLTINPLKIASKAKIPNHLVLDLIKELKNDKTLNIHLCIEKFKSYGMPMGQTTIDSIEWGGRFIQAFDNAAQTLSVPRKTITKHHCHSGKAKDGNVRQALIDRFEPDLPPKKRPKGFLKGISKDEWSALAIALYYYDNGFLTP